MREMFSRHMTYDCFNHQTSSATDECIIIHIQYTAFKPEAENNYFLCKEYKNATHSAVRTVASPDDNGRCGLSCRHNGCRSGCRRLRVRHIHLTLGRSAIVVRGLGGRVRGGICRWVGRICWWVGSVCLWIWGGVRRRGVRRGSGFLCVTHSLRFL